MPPRKKAKAPEPEAPKLPLAVVADNHHHNHARHGGLMVDGLNRRGRETVEVLNRAIAAAKAAGAKMLVVAGDFTHVKNPSPALIAALMLALDDPELQIVLVPGNHDMADASAEGGNTACAPYALVATVVTSPEWYVPVDGLAVLCVPFDARTPMADHVEAAVRAAMADRPKAYRSVLVTHVGVFDEVGAAPWQLRARDGMSATRLLALLSEVGLNAAFVGNYHEHRIWSDGDRRVVQVGTLCPASHGDGGTQGRGLVALTDGVQVGTLEVPGPRFITMAAADLDDPDKAPPVPADPATTYYLRVVGGTEPPDLHGMHSSVVAVDWVPEAIAAASPEAGHVPMSATPEQALVAAVDAVPEERRAAVDAMVKQAWLEGA